MPSTNAMLQLDGKVLGVWPGEKSGPAWLSVEHSERAVTDWKPLERTIRLDQALTPIGIQQTLQAKSAGALALLERAASFLAQARTAADTLRTTYLEPSRAVDQVEQGFHQEIRTWFRRDIAPEDRGVLVTRRLAAQDIQFARALFFAPAAFELIDDLMRDQLGEVLLRTANPEKYAKWKLQVEQIGVAQNVVTYAEERVKGSINMPSSQAARRDSDADFATRLVVA